MGRAGGGPRPRGPHRASLQTLAGDLGLVLHLTAALAAVSLPVAALSGERWALLPLAGTGLASGMVGLLLHRRFGFVQRHTTRTALAVVATAWTVTGLLAALILSWMAHVAPDGAIAVYRDPMNALFEGISGITSTGLTMAHGVESALPATVQWWRSLLQWVGAIGVIVFTLAVASTGAGGEILLASATRPELLGDDAMTTARRIWGLYVALTVAAIAVLKLAGLDWWTAVNHGLSGIGTGGFTITDASFGDHPPAARYAGAGVIAVGAVTFVAHYQLLVGRDVRRFLRRTQVRAFGLGLLVGIPLLALAVRDQAPPVAAVDVIFQWTTALATAGFSTVDLSEWGPAALLLLVVAMFVGGSSGSTAGGLKLSRVAWLAKALMTRIRSAEPGQRELEHRWDGEPVSPDHSRRAESHAAGMALLWAVTLAAGAFAMLLLVPGAAPQHVLFDVTSALSNVGLDTGVVDRDLHGPAKATFILLMALGRLEILGLLVLARVFVVAQEGGEEAAEEPPPGA